jgi:hypothetical protein
MEQLDITQFSEPDGLRPSNTFASPDQGWANNSAWPWLTVEKTLWLGVFFLAAFLRFVALGARPLSDSEAAIALQSWAVVRGQPVDLMAQPLLVYGTALVTLVLGANDTTVRLIPALAGTILVVLPYLVRDYLGRILALGAALLLSISPVCVFFSTTVDCSMLAAALSFTIVAVFLRRGLTFRTQLIGTLLGALLASGPVGVACGLLLAGACGVPYGWRKWRSLRQNLATRLIAGPTEWKTLAIFALAAYALGATGFGANLGGMQAGIPDGLVAWFGGLSFGWQPLVVFAAYELLTLAMAVSALSASMGDGQVRFWLAMALVAGLAIAFVSGEQRPGMILLSIVPVCLLAGRIAGEVFVLLLNAVFRRRLVWSALVIGPWAFLLWLWAGHFSRPNADAWIALGPDYPKILLLAVGIIFLAAVAFIVWWFGLSLALRQLTVSITILAAVFALHNSFYLVAPNLESPTQPLLARATSPDIRTLVAELKDATAAQAYYPGISDVQVEDKLNAPLAWYLREIPAIRFVNQTDERATAAVINAESRMPGQKYRARRFQLAFVNQGNLLDAPMDQLWRWFMFRERLAQPVSEGVLLLVHTR